MCLGRIDVYVVTNILGSMDNYAGGECLGYISEAEILAEKEAL